MGKYVTTIVSMSGTLRTEVREAEGSAEAIAAICAAAGVLPQEEGLKFARAAMSGEVRGIIQVMVRAQRACDECGGRGRDLGTSEFCDACSGTGIRPPSPSEPS